MLTCEPARHLGEHHGGCYHSKGTSAREVLYTQQYKQSFGALAVRLQWLQQRAIQEGAICTIVTKGAPEAHHNTMQVASLLQWSLSRYASCRN
jgi:hypothetical protein